MTTTYSLSISQNPQFQTVTGLTNQVFDRNNIVSGQMATEAQIQQLWQDIITLEQRIDYCCRDIVYWDIQVRIRDKYGNIVTDYLDNRTTGITRRGKNFTMTFPLKAIPKYESQTSNGTNANYFPGGDITACIYNGTSYTLYNDLCSLLYRGNEGQYYEMSQRKTTGGLGIGIVSASQNGTNILADGSEYSRIFSNSGNVNHQNKHFTSVDGDGNISILCNLPIDNALVDSVRDNNTKAYGRVYRFDLRDVTIGS